MSTSDAKKYGTAFMALAPKPPGSQVCTPLYSSSKCTSTDSNSAGMAFSALTIALAMADVRGCSVRGGHRSACSLSVSEMQVHAWVSAVTRLGWSTLAWYTKCLRMAGDMPYTVMAVEDEEEEEAEAEVEEAEAEVEEAEAEVEEAEAAVVGVG